MRPLKRFLAAALRVLRCRRQESITFEIETTNIPVRKVVDFR